MDDMYEDDPNSWFKRTRYSKSGYSRHPLVKPEFYYRLNSNQADSASMIVTQDDTSGTKKNGLTDKVSACSDIRRMKRSLVSIHGAISDMLKGMQSTVRKRFLARLSTKIMLNSSSRKKNKSRGLKKYFGREVCQVAPPDESGEGNWTPDINELIRWKEMADRVRCPLFREESVRLRQSNLED